MDKFDSREKAKLQSELNQVKSKLLELEKRTEEQQSLKLNNGKSDDNLCVICLVSPKNHAIVPCGHLCLCENCSVHYVDNDKKSGSCPICRNDVTMVMKVYS